MVELALRTNWKKRCSAADASRLPRRLRKAILVECQWSSSPSHNESRASGRAAGLATMVGKNNPYLTGAIDFGRTGSSDDIQEPDFPLIGPRSNLAERRS
jgi:hypothetical protein